ncbi:glycerophosphodiester phosphodiesterase domain-containing protein 4-like [Lontra canadensis]|uniref:glycerophosphodiester phosphodiesterase domain-containing protein 4-like n=1 Tax=Lontra canadensis TaxID=76717 RepID=UPI0013F3724E|nr:glycerophosphodiester phosphodiesterase domain-containing protein 4-like [Lontra canadensis]
MPDAACVQRVKMLFLAHFPSYSWTEPKRCTMLKGNRIEPGSQRRVKRHYPWILCGCNRQCYITLITGCYTCEWQFKQEKKSLPGPCCCSWREKLFYPFLIASFLLSLILLFLWIETSNDYFGFDW